MLKPGLYEHVINKELSSEIDQSQQLIDKRSIDKADPSLLSLTRDYAFCSAIRDIAERLHIST